VLLSGSCVAYTRPESLAKNREEMAANKQTRSRDLLDAASCGVSVREIRDLRRFVSTAMALDLFLGETPEIQQRGYDGLVRRCKRSLRLNGLRVPDGGHSSANFPGSLDMYLLDEIGRLIFAYRPLSRRSILLAALRGEFRYIPRKVCLHFIDMVRKENAKRRRKHSRKPLLRCSINAAFSPRHS